MTGRARKDIFASGVSGLWWDCGHERERWNQKWVMLKERREETGGWARCICGGDGGMDSKRLKIEGGRRWWCHFLG